MPISALEALGCGVPIVASNVGGLGDIVIDGFNGYLTNPEDVNDLVRKINNAAETRWNRQEIANKAKVQYAWDRWASEIIELINERNRVRA
jgi:glycosyltransferase involved in cell wall biosynthesis